MVQGGAEYRKLAAVSQTTKRATRVAISRVCTMHVIRRPAARLRQ